MPGLLLTNSAGNEVAFWYRKKALGVKNSNKYSIVKRKPLRGGNEARGESPIHASFPLKAENGQSSRSNPTFKKKIITVNAIVTRFLKFLYRFVA